MFTAFSFVSQPGLTKCGDIHSVPLQFRSDEGCASLGTIGGVSVQERADIPCSNIKRSNPPIFCIFLFISTAVEGAPPTAVSWPGFEGAGNV